MNNLPIRLNKFLAERLGVSRREADELISSGQISIDHKIATLGDKVDRNSKVCYNNKTIPIEAKFLYLALHKPVGYICSRHAQGSTPTLYKLLPKKYHKLKTVGRLDKDSSGLILLTNDGDFAFQMTHPKFRKQKVYEVDLNQPLQPLHQQIITDYGVMLPDGVSQFKVIGPLDKKQATPHYTVILSEGRNRQIRRTFAALGYEVVRLHRTSFGNYELNNLAPGEFQEFKK